MQESGAGHEEEKLCIRADGLCLPHLASRGTESYGGGWNACWLTEAVLPGRWVHDMRAQWKGQCRDIENAFLLAEGVGLG